LCEYLWTFCVLCCCCSRIEVHTDFVDMILHRETQIRLNPPSVPPSAHSPGTYKKYEAVSIRSPHLGWKKHKIIPYALKKIGPVLLFCCFLPKFKYANSSIKLTQKPIS
jgi:hypothetical protein